MIPTRVAVINLARRVRRLHNFTRRWEATGVSLPLTVIEGFDTPRDPQNGCHAAHMDALSFGESEPLLVLEDDAVFAPQFPEVLAALDIPGEWDLAYLGGEHLTQPRPVREGLVRCASVRRTHAYIARRPDKLVKQLTAVGHIDEVFNLLRLTRYAVVPFVVGQAAGTSDITTEVRAEDDFFN